MSGAMLAATLDTSCALNFLGHDAEADDALSDLVAAAFAGRLNLRVTEQAFVEVAHTAEDIVRRQRLARLRAFRCVELPDSMVEKRDGLAAELKAALFPGSRLGSRTDRHNQGDCLQLATHALVGRDVFCTRDGKLLTSERATAAANFGIAIASPADLLARISEEDRHGQQPSAPSLAVRDVDVDRDEGAVREVLKPLSEDYPDFRSWLNGRLAKAAAGEVRVRVGLVGDQIGAVALSTQKDERVVKLSAFYVSEGARTAGLGQHLLWAELRAWATSGVEKVYVTVSSRHGELVGFFSDFGFLVEGVSPRRYQDDTAEIVLGKHLIRRVVDAAGLDSFVDEVASRVFSAPASIAPDGETWALPPASIHPEFRWEGAGGSLRLVAYEDGTASRRWGLLELERAFHPVRFTLPGRKALLVPIQPRWADAMLEYTNQQQNLFAADASSRLLLRAENAYYCYPTALGVARPGTPILFFVSGDVGLVGEARVIDAMVDIPEELFAKFGGLGIYGIDDIRGHVGKRGEHRGHSLAMRFGSYVPFSAPVKLKRMQTILARKVIPQAITPIAGEEFEALRRTGGLEW
jgi:N-acetylglutamate synthase-like GNAT family acetyltransferase